MSLRELESKYHRYLDLQSRGLPIGAWLTELQTYQVPLYADATTRPEAEITAQIAQIQGFLDRAVFMRTQSLAMRELWLRLHAEYEAEIDAFIDNVLVTNTTIRNLSPDSIRKAAAKREVPPGYKRNLQCVISEESAVATFDRQVQVRVERLQGTYEALSRQIHVIGQLRNRELLRLQPQLGHGG